MTDDAIRPPDAPGESEAEAPLGPGPRVVIVGLGELGRGIGRALAAVRANFALIGHDPMPERVGLARDTGAFDRFDWNLARAVEEADLVVLAEPLETLLETLAAVATHVRPGAVITDTASVKGPVMAAARTLPDGVAFVGGHPIVDAGAAATDPAAFHGAPWCLMPAPSAGEDTLRALDRLVRAVGAEPYYIDAGEHDALIVGAVVLPGLLADAVMRVVAGSPSADDLKRLAGPALDALVAAPPADTDATRSAPRAVMAWIDQLIADLGAARAALAEGAEADAAALAERADAARAAWMADREAPGVREAREALADRQGIRDFVFGRLGRRQRRTE